jgi:type II secretory pathway pseudopilin PulG
MAVSIAATTTAAIRAASRAGARLGRIAAGFADRLLVGALVASVSIIPAVAAGWSGQCLVRIAVYVAVSAAVGSLVIRPEGRLRRVVVHLATGITSIEVLITAAIVSIVIVGVAFEYGAQHGSTTREANSEALRDVGSAIDVDAAAIAAYDANARAAYSGLGSQTSNITVNGQTAKVQLNGGAGGLAVSVTTPDGAQANLVAPLPNAKPVPQ